MYGLEWIEHLKRRRAAQPRAAVQISPVVWSLGFTSLLTDISSEMVNSALPVYLVLHLHLSPLQYGLIDGLYNGFAVALVSLAAGVVADRMRGHKRIALVGYGASAFCKLLLPLAGGAWGWISAIVGLDRMGKGLRTAPRDAIISLNTPGPFLANAFAVHRALDAGGSLLGPIVAFALLWQLPAAFDVVWMTSFVFAILGVAVLCLFVPGAQPVKPSAPRMAPLGPAIRRLMSTRFRVLVICGLLLSVTTISDGFLYLLMVERGGAWESYLPLFYVVTAGFYMLFSVPVGRAADRFGRTRMLFGGYAVLGLVYCLVLSQSSLGSLGLFGCLALLGVYYAGTEGILMAMGSALIPAELRASGLAMLATAIGIGKVISSILFGLMWQTYGIVPAVSLFAAALLVAIVAAALWLQASKRGQSIV